MRLPVGGGNGVCIDTNIVMGIAHTWPAAIVHEPRRQPREEVQQPFQAHLRRALQQERRPQVACGVAVAVAEDVVVLTVEHTDGRMLVVLALPDCRLPRGYVRRCVVMVEHRQQHPPAHVGRRSFAESRNRIG
eukprot:scaffold39825_cov37-Tisochrysis_lutea.AAC.1